MANEKTVRMQLAFRYPQNLLPLSALSMSECSLGGHGLIPRQRAGRPSDLLLSVLFDLVQAGAGETDLNGESYIQDLQLTVGATISTHATTWKKQARGLFPARANMVRARRT